MKRLSVVVVLCVGLAGVAFAGGVGIRGGAGTDVNGGVSYGAGINYAVDIGSHALELGLLYFGGSFSETTAQWSHTYEETTDVSVMGVLANVLFGYDDGDAGVFVITGFGIGNISVDWEEKSDTDTSLGTWLSGGGSTQSDDASAVGAVLNIGLGLSLGRALDLRAEAPIIIITEAPGDASSIVPAVMLTGGLRF